MDFYQLSNDLIWVFVILLGITLTVGMITGFRNGGWNRNLPYLWTLIVYTQYLFVTPLFFYLNGKKTLNGTDFSGYYGIGFFFNWISILSFVIGYWIKGRLSNADWDAPNTREIKNPGRKIAILFYLFYGIVMANMAGGGIDLSGVFLGREEVGLGAKGATYYLQNFSDSLISLLVLAYLFNVRTRTILIWTVMSFFLFSLLGFRYRIILTLFGFLFVFLLKNKIMLRQFLIGVTLTLVFFYLVMFSTENRRVLITRHYESLAINPAEYNYENFFDQTRGALADMCIYKYYDNPNKNAEHDYGVSMFGYIFIRMIPRSVMPDKDKYYPPPQIKTTLASYDAWWGKFTGEASLSVACLYIAFGFSGIIFGHFFWGLILRRVSSKIRAHDPISISKYIVIALVSFQWITRGYFPQVLDHFVYMFFPIIILSYLSKKQIEKSAVADNQPRHEQQHIIYGN